MKKSTKNGVTLISLVIYILLFSSFTVFVSIVSTNMNKRLLDNRGEAINYSNLNKLQYNFENSSMNSNDVSLSQDKIVYSNGDTYEYNESEKVIYKNSGILCLNVEEFTATMESNMNVKRVKVDIRFNKYLNVIQKSIITCVEGY